MQADMVAGGKGQATGHFAGEIAQGAAGIIQYVDDLISARQQGAASLGEIDVAAQAIEQAHIQLLFQSGNTLADGWLGEVQALARAGKAAGFSHGDKGIEVGEVHCLAIPLGYPKHKNYEFELFNLPA
ncbi:hypothetical protein D9M71_585140 [compost metagenome]